MSQVGSLWLHAWVGLPPRSSAQGLCPGGQLDEPQHWGQELLLTSCLLQFWQLYNAITLFNMLQHPECKEWQVRAGGQASALGRGMAPRQVPPADLWLPQVLMCGLPFFILFLGNFFTTLRVVHQKIQDKHQDRKQD